MDGLSGVMPARRRLMFGVARHAVLLTATAVFLTPMVVLALTAVMDDHQVLSPSLWPHPFRWSNFNDLFARAPIARYAWNSTRVTALSTIGVVLSSVPVAYALAKLRWRGRHVVLLVLVTTFLLPPQAVLVPLYVLFAKLHWVGSIKPLVIPAFFADPFSVFVLRQFFLTVPDSLLDAARVEGAGELQVLWRVVAPMTRPAIAAVALLHAFFTWNDFVGPLLFLGEDRQQWTLSLGLAQLRTIHQVDWNLTMAASLITLAPVAVLFLAAQRALLDGVAALGRAS